MMVDSLKLMLVAKTMAELTSMVHEATCAEVINTVVCNCVTSLVRRVTREAVLNSSILENEKIALCQIMPYGLPANPLAGIG